MRNRIFYYLILFTVVNNAIIAQGLKGCAFSSCKHEYRSLALDGLKKATKKDSLRGYHLLACLKYFLDSDLDSAIYFLDIVDKMDKVYLSKIYLGDRYMFENFGNHSSLINVASIPNKEKYLDYEFILKENEYNNRKLDLDTFFQKLYILDQSAERKNLSRTGNNDVLSLINMKKKDEIIKNELIKKFKDEKKYFARKITNDERFVLSTILLHQVENLMEYNVDFFKILIENGNITSGNYSMSIARYYCGKFGSSPIDSPYCETDRKLISNLKEDFPYYLTLTLKE